MNRRVLIVTSVILIVIGILSLLSSVAGFAFGFRMWQLWPLLVIAAGLAFVLPPLLVRGKRGLGGLFIPGLPILANGCILLFTSVTRWWSAWSWLWPVEVISVALGFLLAAVYMRVVWLLVPAIVIGANGALFQFCAITGWWAAWAVAWVIEPLSIGLALLLVNLKYRSAGLFIPGVLLCGLALLGAIWSVAITVFSVFLPFWWLWNWMLPLGCILVGVALLIWGVTRRAPANGLVAG